MTTRRVMERHERTPVCNLTIQGLHAFTVGKMGVLVHNTSGSLSGKTVAEILKTKLSSIKNAPLPPGSPSWSQILNMTWEEIVAGAKTGKPGFSVFRKLLQDGRFNKP